MIIPALTAVLVMQPMEIRLMRNPDIHSDTIVFSHAGDLWTMDRNDGLARRLTSHPGSESLPKFSPDGKWIAFTGAYDGNPDVFVMPSLGGEPKRVTFSGNVDAVADWTPDGKIAYTSNDENYSNRFDRLFIVDPSGSMPQRTILQEVADCSFSPDGSTVAFARADSHGFNWRRYRGGTQGYIEFYNMKSGAWSEIPHGKENSWQPFWVGNNVYYISDKDFGTRNLFRYDVGSKRVTRLTEFRDADIKNPTGDDKSLIWERNGFLETYDLASNKVSRVKAQVLSDFLAARPRMANVAPTISGLALSPSGVRVAADARGDIFSIPAKNGDTRNLTDSQGVREQNPEWSPDGQRIFYISDASGEKQLYSRPQMGGESKLHRVDKLIAGYTFSPDGKTITYGTSDGRLFLHNVESGAETLVVQSAWQSGINFDWSHDGSYIAYVIAGDNLMGQLHLYDVADKKSTKISDGFYSDDIVSFDQTGKYLYLVSSRTFSPSGGAFEFMLNMDAPQRVYAITLDKTVANPLLPPSDEEPVKAPEKPADKPATPPPAADPPKPVEPEKPKKLKIDFDGLASRIFPLPTQPGNYQILGVSNGCIIFGQQGAFLFSMGARQMLPVYQGPVLGANFNASRTKAVINTGQGISIIPLAPGADANAGAVRTNNVTMMWDPKAEWKQIFWESWRWQRDVFYDPNMLGLDWKAIGDQYAAYLPHLHNRGDLNYILGLMIGELGTGHAYVGGGDVGSQGTSVPTGMLGCDYEVVGDAVKIAKVFEGGQYDESTRGPLGELGMNVKAGSTLVSIDGVNVSRTSHPAKLLVGKVGRNVNVTIQDPDGTKRDLKVRPVSNENAIRYRQWVDENRAKVTALSGGKIGYVHVPDTSIEGVIEFMRGFYSQTDKQAWVIDERYNGGGMIPTFFIEFLQREYVAKMKARNWKDIGFPTGTWQGPKAMLVNEYAGSGGDMLPWLFKEAKLGALIGRRTWGGLVGIQGSAPLVDGGFLTSPGFGIYDHKNGKWIAENTGVDPDIEVDLRADQIAQGKDPQLEKAVQHLLNELKKGPKPSKTPDFIQPKPGK